MNRNIASCFLLGCIAFVARAEPTESPSPFTDSIHSTLELSVAAASQTWAPSLSVNAFYGFGASRSFQLGLGLRASAFLAGGHSVAYSTADAQLIDEGKINVLTFGGMQTYSLNAVLQFRYTFAPQWEVGMNIDLIGLGFGGPKIGWYGATDPLLSGPQQAHPSSFNLLLGGNRDRGQLNSEFYIGYDLTPVWHLRAGLSHFFSEVTTDAVNDFGNRRFRVIRNLFFVSGVYRL